MSDHVDPMHAISWICDLGQAVWSLHPYFSIHSMGKIIDLTFLPSGFVVRIQWNNPCEGFNPLLLAYKFSISFNNYYHYYKKIKREHDYYIWSLCVALIGCKRIECNEYFNFLDNRHLCLSFSIPTVYYCTMLSHNLPILDFSLYFLVFL